MRHAMKASDLLALVQEFVATHGGDTEIIRIEWELRTIGGEFNVRIEILTRTQPRPAPQEEATP